MRAVWAWTLLAVACAGPRPQPPRPAEAAATGAPVELAYADAGAGSPIVLIHGAWGDLRTYSRAIPVLSAGHRLIVPSLRYHWPNPWPSSDDEAYAQYTVETHARDVAALIERLGIAPVDLVGHSYGGNVAAVLALSRPELVRRRSMSAPRAPRRPAGESPRSLAVEVLVNGVSTALAVLVPLRSLHSQQLESAHVRTGRHAARPYSASRSLARPAPPRSHDDGRETGGGNPSGPRSATDE
ncbi:MAG TPA: alpha/beta hydrolase [Anaeromyxobacter sp.]|nr:alpha/beta hydrolase [Anaeromyxobacter sp.]